MSYVQQIVQPIALAKMNNYITKCNKCKQCDTIKTIAYGNPNATLFIIGDHASKEQANNTNEPVEAPFKDKGGEILHQIFNKLNINEKEIMYMNVLNCYPYKKIDSSTVVERSPKRSEISNCYNYIKYALDIVKPRYILILGNIALNVFTKQILYNYHGKKFYINNTPSLATFNPNDIVNEEDDEMKQINSEMMYLDIKNLFLDIKNKYPNSNLFK